VVEILNNIREKGFTLVELLIGMSIMTIIMTGVFGVLYSSVKSYKYSWEQGSNIQDTQGVLTLVSNEIRNATSISTPGFTANQITSGSRIDYQVVVNSITEQHSIYVGSNSDINTIILSVNGSIKKKLAINRVEQITFTRDGINKGRVTINLIVQNQANSATPTMQITNTVTTLNNIL